MQKILPPAYLFLPNRKLGLASAPSGLFPTIAAASGSLALWIFPHERGGSAGTGGIAETVRFKRAVAQAGPPRFR